MQKKNIKRQLLLPVVMLILFSSCKEKVSPPTVLTGEATLFNDTRIAACEGNVISDGGGLVTERGICYMQGEGTPELSDGSKRGGNGCGAFTCALNSLNASTYSYRAYATNEAGTVYGETKTISFDGSGGGGSGGGGSGGGGGGTSTLTINDFLGTYKCSAYNNSSNKYENWDNVNISTFTGSDNTTWIYVEGIYLGYSFFAALGKFDAQNQCLRLFSDWYLSNRLFNFSGDDTSYYGTFQPVYMEDEGFYWLYGGNGQDGSSEAWLTFNSEGKLTYGPSNVADSKNRYANGFTFKYYSSDDNVYRGYLPVYTNITLTKTGDGAVRGLRKSAVSEEKLVLLSKKAAKMPAGKKLLLKGTATPSVEPLSF